MNKHVSRLASLRYALIGVPVLLAAFPLGAAAQVANAPERQAQLAAVEVMTPELVAKLRAVGQTVASPAGTHVAFTLSVPRTPFRDEDGPAWTELHVLDLSTGTARPFVSGAVNVRSLGWTPDGSAVTYIATREGDEQAALYAIPLTGGESVRLLEHDAGVSSYSFSPDGRQVAFLAREAKNPRTKELAAHGVKPEFYEEELRFSRLWVAPVELGSIGGQASSSAEAMLGPRQIELEGHVSSVLWAPTGTQVVTTVAPTPLVDDSYMYRRIRVVDVATGEVVASIENPGKLGQIAWSPDAQHLAFISGQDINDPLQGRLMVVRASGGELLDLVPNFEGHVTAVFWRDPATLAYLADVGVRTMVAEVGVDGTAGPTLVAPGEPILNSMTASTDGALMSFAGDSPQHPNEVYVLGPGDETPRRMTDSNPWLADVTLAPQEAVEWTARDGLRLEGVLIRPLDEQEGRTYPLIVVVHGGPEAHFTDGWLTAYSRPGQVAAAEGIAVFYPNYRASTGRGVEFSKLNHEDTAGGEFDDIVDGVDHLIAIGLVDPDRVGVTGGSYGGYATAWLTTRYSDRFAAGVMFVGISNQISKVGTSDIPDEMYLVHQRLRPWDDWQFFLERSPIYYADQSVTPLLILHGKEDPRVHPGQSMEMYRNLKLRGNAPVRLIFYPGEGHGNRNAAARYDYNLRSLRWLEHYLLGPGGDMPPTELEYPLEGADQPPERVTRAAS